MMSAQKSEAHGKLPRAWRFLKKPRHEQLRSLRFRWTSLKFRWAEIIANIPVPLLLPYGAWWLVRNDTTGRLVRKGQFESAELSFVERFLQPGMTALDLGAHHGLYTVLASKRVGRGGQVIAFEPSPRERKALRLHLLLNRCKNVSIQALALGDEEAESDLYVVDDWAAGCNSLRPPDVPAQTFTIRVQVARLDSWLAERRIDSVDFVKLDVEGAELAALKGASQLLSRQPRPVILAELQDVRTEPWGYRAKDAAAYVQSFGFRWFRLLSGGGLAPLPENLDQYEGNFVAVPEERMDQIKEINGSRP
jgi:FkbM family methyltransferase